MPTAPGSVAEHAETTEQSLLSEQEEIELASRIEAARLAVRERIANSALRLPEVEELAHEIAVDGWRREPVLRGLLPSSDPNERDALAKSVLRLGKLERQHSAMAKAQHRAKAQPQKSPGLDEAALQRLRARRKNALLNVDFTDQFWLGVATRLRRLLEAHGVARHNRRSFSLIRQCGLPKRALESLLLSMERDLLHAERARSRLIASNLRLVHWYAHRFVGRGLPLEDLVQEGNMGLMRAVDKFDHRRGYRFSTYASWWIRQAMQRALANQSRTIRVPSHMNTSMQRLAKVTQELSHELGHQPTERQLAERLKWSPEKVDVVQHAAVHTISADASNDQFEGRPLSEKFEDRDAARADDHLIEAERAAKTRRLLEMLTPRERKVLCMRFGIGSGKDHTLRQIGADLHVSRERARQIEAEALKKLQSVLRTETG